MCSFVSCRLPATPYCERLSLSLTKKWDLWQLWGFGNLVRTALVKPPTHTHSQAHAFADSTAENWTRPFQWQSSGTQESKRWRRDQHSAPFTLNCSIEFSLHSWCTLFSRDHVRIMQTEHNLVWRIWHQYVCDSASCPMSSASLSFVAIHSSILKFPPFDIYQENMFHP